MLAELKYELEKIYDSRYILKSLVIKNLVGRYRNSLLGLGWHFVTPVMLLLVYYTVFTQIRIVVIPDFWIYLTSGLFPFNYMISNLTGGSACIINNAGIVKKMSFPRIIIVLSQVISTCVVMIIGYLIILVLIAISGFGFSLSVIMLPILIFMTFIFSLGLVMLFSSLTVYVRDIHYFLSSISMVFFFLTPMYFLSDSISGVFSLIVSINPLTYFVESFHDVVFYQSFPDPLHLSMTIILSVVSLMIGLLVFSKLKSGFVERL